MDQKVIGGFLKELRKEKGITQEQFAEIIGVSSRSLSRWETGSNMPDLDVLILIADYYEVELREILDGERKSEKMNQELEDTVLKVADYSTNEKRVYAGDEWKARKVEKVEKKAMGPDCSVKRKVRLCAERGCTMCGLYLFLKVEMKRDWRTQMFSDKMEKGYKKKDRINFVTNRKLLRLIGTRR